MRKILFALAALIALPAHADQVEWRVLGPAWSWHASTAYAPRAARPDWSCQNMSQNQSGGITANGGAWWASTPPAGSQPIQPAPGVNAQVTETPGTTVNGVRNFTGCMRGSQWPRWQNIGWSQANPAIGVERDVRSEDHIDFGFVDVVRDSLATESLMLGGGRKWPIAHFGSVEIDAGAAAGVWWRSETAGQFNQYIHRYVTPFVLPVLTIDEKHSGIGINFGLAPKARIFGLTLNNTWTLMGQVTLRVK